MHEQSTSGARDRAARTERASSTIEYVGLGSIATLLVTGIAGAIDSTAGDRVGAAVVRRLVAVISGIE